MIGCNSKHLQFDYNVFISFCVRSNTTSIRYDNLLHVLVVRVHN